MPTHCRCCRVLLAIREPGPLCSRCAAGACPRGRPHRRVVIDLDGRVRRVPAGGPR